MMAGRLKKAKRRRRQLYVVDSLRAALDTDSDALSLILPA